MNDETFAVALGDLSHLMQTEELPAPIAVVPSTGGVMVEVAGEDHFERWRKAIGSPNASRFSDQVRSRFSVKGYTRSGLALVLLAYERKAA